MSVGKGSGRAFFLLGAFVGFLLVLAWLGDFWGGRERGRLRCMGGGLVCVGDEFNWISSLSSGYSYAKIIKFRCGDETGGIESALYNRCKNSYYKFSVKFRNTVYDFDIVDKTITKIVARPIVF